MMTIPENEILYQHPMATFWFDNLGILHSVSKTGPRTMDLMDDYIGFVNTITKGQKVCILTDISKASPMDKATREYTAGQLLKVYKAMGIISDSPMGIAIGNIYLQLEDQPFPSRIFLTEKDAYDWLKGFL
jgi:hypothetical protein